MAVKIRLRRTGRKKLPSYQIVVANSRAPRDGKYIEILGQYFPLLEAKNPDRIKISLEKTKAWLDKGAQMTETVEKLYKKVTGSQAISNS